MEAVDHLNGVKVYDLCVGKTLPQWLSAKRKRSLRKDEDYRRRIELLQDFDFKNSSQRIQVSNNGVNIVVTGTYPPMVKVFDTQELSLKFERHLDSQVVQFQVLSDDYSKLVFLGMDRSLSFHAAYGSHYSLRVPKFGRDLAYDPFGCELYTGCSGSSVYRLDLEQGTFVAPFETCHDNGVNVIEYSEMLQMLACGGDDEYVSCWDVRAKQEVGRLEIGHDMVTTACKLDGITMAIGTSTGLVKVYDLRSSKPMQTKQHPNEEKIVSLQFQTPGRLIISADSNSIRMWNKDNGKSFVNIEPQAEVNEIFLVKQNDNATKSSGLLFAAGEMDRVMSFYVPRLGQAPVWASFLENLSEELEEKSRGSQELYENYKFVTQQDLEKLGVSNLLGTSLLRAYMHGYFMDMRLYHKIKSVSEPTDFEQHRKERIKKKLEEKLGQRIVRKTPKSNLPKVNRELAKHLQAKSFAPKKDDRFTALFEDPDFEIDQDSEHFKQVYASGFGGAPTDGKLANEDDSEDEAHQELQRNNKMENEELKKAKKKKKQVVLMEDENDVGAALIVEKDKKTKRKKKAKTIKEKLDLQNETAEQVKRLPNGNMEISFASK